MCCFSGTVESVSDTNIFARFADKNHQFLAYSMKMKARDELAMILPIPVPRKTKDDAVKFINLEGYPDFFKDMKKGFPQPPPPRSKKGAGGGGFGGGKPQLKVVDVGKFEASFVPTVDDFSRLDERFRLPNTTWKAIPKYRRYGFAVFKLKPGAKPAPKSDEKESGFGSGVIPDNSSEQTFHPMAFQFPTDSVKLFFPTVHIHDGKVHTREHFDHSLYCQLTAGDQSPLYNFRESPQPASMFLEEKKSAGLIAPDQHCYQRIIKGNQRNADVWV